MTSCATVGGTTKTGRRHSRGSCARGARVDRANGVPGQRFPLPTSGRIVTDAAPVDARRALHSVPGEGYAYQITTVKPHEGRFAQMGSAPNLEGGLITLCTCKHFMRAGRDVDRWPGQWIAGFTSVGRDGWDRHYLVYVMRVEHAFASHAELWAWLQEKGVESSKAADQNTYGDVYRPVDPEGDAHAWRNYHPPSEGHPHCKPQDWHRDIWDETAELWRRRPSALLVGDPRLSFVWDRPMVYLPGKLARTKRFTLDSLLADLCEVEP